MSKLMRLKLINAVILLTLTASIAQAASEPIDSAKIIYVLKQTRAVKPEMQVSATMVGKQAIIILPRVEKSTDRDCKIDAVFISKELFSAFPDQISRVRLLFSRAKSNSASQVDVTLGDVKAFGSGAMNADSLLSSLELSEVEGMNSSSSSGQLSIAPGPLADKRLLLLSRIESLRSKGTSVKPFMDIFNKLEAEVSSATPEQLTKDVAYLTDKLTEQEELVRQASVRKTSARGPSALPGKPLFSSDSQAIERRCKDWSAKLDLWKSQGRDVAQLVAAISVTRMLLADQTPENIQKAGATLDGLDFLFKSGPPPMRQ